MPHSTFLQAGSAIPSTPIELVRSATVPTQIVLVLLVLLSLTSWGIMLAKWLEFRRMHAAADAFLRDFGRASRLEQAAALAKRVKPSPYTRVFARAVQFVQETRPLAVEGGGAPHAPLTAAQVEALRLVLDAETNAERDQLGRAIPGLAVIGSASPLLGLLGTVLGVISAFLGVATKGSGNLGAVAPGVAEALIATAVALAVAIPAVFGYNIFATKLNRFDGELEGFGSEVIALMAREGRIV
ncbi:MAG TPA: MotA/TolQ/ExbB proton channel family protein [Gemmatimonadaceae bacterium]|nr:MotA/TolQ/ExbB proton channel family protein [Gemmatimonadaceae bacterium]